MTNPDTPLRRVSPRYGEGRSALLAAAVHVVAERGLRRLTYREVARQAGVAHGLVAHHFGSGESLLEAALEFSLHNSVTAISSRPGSGDIDALLEGLSSMIDANPHDQAFQYELMLESRRTPGLTVHVRAIYDAYIEALRCELSAAGVDPDPALCHLVYSAADGLVFHQITLGNPALMDRSIDHLRALLELSRNNRG
ncbi:TetR/AcrR family transcriptional regulator [Rhodococcus sp. BP-252]|uniref:TetR/AcrR family transcriptional regulator n=1 Tax=unclassified Rhodococcus (in: high G+C Gram-positive bacteria) TaxID=192944 RepID=UPI001C9B96D0|nr:MULTISPECIES: TetR/AcrR family transcriptional regulator [unclassified Rhodococcus (in: high G+C Gram-positive bacteria)]MBY6414665.1 TetR/AcrR family transcriptional regulator [Rhodococcus sp. BP-320]MBY6419490.1 TetR/AcrR family transcriptional regulator [Rhodococcus sp. BP-321]MBY6424498.1 TetR/AcrR family transcriptional regulator [Rhodococcus sp. BP-324]MBY6429501.1 TetR/AcrR family transcriptional regulator [Rhodococcus sp. BP-323]MBY6434508.1 TetR/AcrR family transcriptional regulato